MTVNILFKLASLFSQHQIFYLLIPSNLSKGSSIAVVMGNLLTAVAYVVLKTFETAKKNFSEHHLCSNFIHVIFLSKYVCRPTRFLLLWTVYSVKKLKK